MIGWLIQLLVVVLILGLVFYVIRETTIPQPWKNVALVIVAIVAILILINFLPPAYFPWRRVGP